MEVLGLIIFVACSMVGSLVIGSILFAIPGAWGFIVGIIVAGFLAGMVIQFARLIVGDF
jgi:hypothetical protein